LVPATLCQSRAIAKIPSLLLGSQFLLIDIFVSLCLVWSIFRLIQVESASDQRESAPSQVESAPDQVESASGQSESASGQVESVPDQVESASDQVESASGQSEFASGEGVVGKMPCGYIGFWERIC
jgi:hypothetical protein